MRIRELPSKEIINWLQLWVNGTSIHLLNSKECVPDFSCCIPELKAPKELRELFLKNLKDGNEYNISSMWAMFISCLVAKESVNYKGLPIIEHAMRRFGNA